MSGELWAKGALFAKINFDYVYRKFLIIPHGNLPSKIFWGCLQSLQTWFSGKRSKPASMHTHNSSFIQLKVFTEQCLEKKNKCYSFHHSPDGLWWSNTPCNTKQWKNTLYRFWHLYNSHSFLSFQSWTILVKKFCLWACSIPLDLGHPFLSMYTTLGETLN